MPRTKQKAPFLVEPNYFSNWGDLWYPRWANIFFLPVAAKIRWLTPNHITILSFILYTSAIVGLNIWPHLWALFGLILPLSYVLDCLDGQLARTTGKSSVIGDYLDKTLDVFKIGVITLGLGYFAYSQTGDVYMIILGFLSCFGFLFRYYIKLETLFSAMSRDSAYLEKSRIHRYALYEKYDNQKKSRKSIADYIKWFAFKNRAVFAFDEAEHVTFGALAILTGNVWLWVVVFGVTQPVIALYRLWQRGSQLKNNPESLLHPLRK